MNTDAVNLIFKNLGTTIENLVPSVIVPQKCDDYQNWCSLEETEQKHEWIFEQGKIPKCSVCGRYSDDADTGEAIACPFCGARMYYKGD